MRGIKERPPIRWGCVAIDADSAGAGVVERVHFQADESEIRIEPNFQHAGQIVGGILLGYADIGKTRRERLETLPVPEGDRDPCVVARAGQRGRRCGGPFGRGHSRLN